MLEPLTDQWEQERTAFSFSSWAGSVLSQKHAWSSDVSLDEESGKIKCSVMKLLLFLLLFCGVLFLFLLGFCFGKSGFSQFPVLQPQGQCNWCCTARTPCTALHEPGMTRGVTQTSSLELFKEQGESLQSKAADTLGFPKASSQCQQRNHRWTRCITALLVGWLMYRLWQSIPSAQQWAGRAGRRAGVWKLSQAESALEFIFKTSPWLQTETKRNQSESMCYCFNNTFACEMFFGAGVITDARFKVIYHALHIAVYSWISFVRKSISGSCTDTNMWLWFFFWLYKLVLIFLRYFFKVRDKYTSGAWFFILFCM